MEEKISEEVTEVLEAVWTLQEQEEPTLEKVIQNAPVEITEGLIARLSHEGLISVDDGKIVRLLPKGRELAEKIIRRHRLAERLICDVLGARWRKAKSRPANTSTCLPKGSPTRYALSWDTRAIVPTTSPSRKETAAGRRATS